MPSPWTIFAFILLSYFMVTGGIIYDVIVEPPSVGSTTDEHGHTRPVAFMPYRVNGQYIMEVRCGALVVAKLICCVCRAWRAASCSPWEGRG